MAALSQLHRSPKAPMDWNALSAIADVVAALAVVLSLIYVAIQVRHNTRATKLAAQQAITSDLGAALQNQASDESLARIMSTGLSDFHALDKTESFRFLSQMGHVFRLYESLFSHHLAGNLDPEVWRGYEQAIRGLLAYPGIQTVWELRSNVYSERFQQFMSDALADGAQASLFGKPTDR